MNRINYAENRPPKGGYATKERMGSLLLSLVLCLSFLPTTARAEDAHANHCICGASHTAVGDHTAETAETWTGVSDLSTITTGGYYYLTADVTLTSTWEPANGTVLCLNGHSIICDAGTNSSNNSGVDVIKVNYGGTASYHIARDKTNNQLKLCTGAAPAHTHTWSYSASGATITATCTDDECPTQSSSVTIAAPTSLTYDSNFTGTPTDVGEYTASITLGGQTASVTYIINSKSITVNAGNITLSGDTTYTGSQINPTVTISTAALTITADNKTAVVGAAMPKLTYTVSGLFSGDTLNPEPKLSCTATDTNTAGTYDITASGAGATIPLAMSPVR